MTIVKEEVVTLAGWPTDIVRVDHPASNTSRQQHPRRTILVFIPGNPGCIGWYQQNLVELVERLGPGFAARGVSYAGHSPTQALTQVDARKSRDIPWTVDGQIEHKCAFLDFILSEEDKSGETKNDPPRLLFLSHSIGSHMVQRLCIIRPDLLARTIGILSLMPYIRMKASKQWTEQSILDWGARNPTTVVRVAKTAMLGLKGLPNRTIVRMMDHPKDGELALSLLRQPNYARNFFELGLEEIRDVPETIDLPALQWIGWHCPMAMLYAGYDQWAPVFHMHQLQQLQQQGQLSSSISFTYREELRHDYVSYMNMVPTVVDWCLESIQNMVLAAAKTTTTTTTNTIIRSKI